MWSFIVRQPSQHAVAAAYATIAPSVRLMLDASRLNDAENPREK